jgi:hypothetical protein
LRYWPKFVRRDSRKPQNPSVKTVGVRSKLQPDAYKSDTELFGLFCERTVKLKVKDDVIPVNTMKAYKGSTFTAPLIPNLGISWRCWGTA